MALDVADRGYVLETGRIALADDAKALRERAGPKDLPRRDLMLLARALVRLSCALTTCIIHRKELDMEKGSVGAVGRLLALASTAVAAQRR